MAVSIAYSNHPALSVDNLTTAAWEQAMFAIPPERQVLGSSMDLKWFLLAVLILATITYLMAAYLGTLVGIWNVIIGWLRSKSAWRDWLKRRNGYKNDAVKEEDHRSEASEPRICLSV